MTWMQCANDSIKLNLIDRNENLIKATTTTNKQRREKKKRKTKNERKIYSLFICTVITYIVSLLWFAFEIDCDSIAQLPIIIIIHHCEWRCPSAFGNAMMSSHEIYTKYCFFFMQSQSLAASVIIVKFRCCYYSILLFSFCVFLMLLLLLFVSIFHRSNTCLHIVRERFISLSSI